MLLGVFPSPPSCTLQVDLLSVYVFSVDARNSFLQRIKRTTRIQNASVVDGSDVEALSAEEGSPGKVVSSHMETRVDSSFGTM